MAKYQLKGKLADLQEGIKRDAPKFGFTASELATQLRFVAFDYNVGYVKSRHANTRGETLEKISNLEAGLKASKTRRAGVPSDATLSLVTGQHPAPFMQLQSDEGDRNIMLPDRLDLVVSAIKQKAALDFRARSTDLTQVGRVMNGLEIFGDADASVVRRRLELLADESPEVFRAAIDRAGANLKTMLQIGEGRGGRSIKLSHGLDALPRWKLITDVLDIIWPQANGRLKGAELTAALNIVDHVLFYVHGVKSSGEQVKNSRGGKVLAAGEEPAAERRGEGIDRNLFEYAVALRYQIHTLEKAVSHVERRVGTLQSQLGNCPDYIVARWMKVWEFGFHPLNDWLEELNRRLRHGDYRPTDGNVRRFTMGILGLPDMPRIDADLPPSRIAAQLLRAWHRFERDGKPAAHNKGKKTVPAPGKVSKSASTKQVVPPTLAQLKKLNKIRMKKRIAKR